MNEINCLLCCYAVVSKSDYDEVKAQLEKAKKALAFYASAENWPDEDLFYPFTQIDLDFGEKARSILNELL